ncbi:SDR family NAD(P)-dependent oxidoreductase [Pseudoxanthomonas indica]|uniref:2-keto-3-deoxy-L-fuconate dehydrogenase n=1 Tax=Pseudoxanthomonas indica TaxID=428993 RepID=A0A1T5LLU4_9GAMM|nr:SDR family oxidoreductase [Pseudoxanthomonas indica]GGD36795.1 3-oxoacyl-ACP reductase [Pseudoxanthomonas indica]SKC76967.1 2-keto-3-deoxy-L-fuconate dehydrogenase [Pseudoxanthomonas indica]
MPRLDNEVVVITGAAGAIGAETCRRFAAAGARIAALDLRQPDEGELALACDLGDDASVASAAARIRAELGEPTIVVHAAATTEFATTLESSPQAFARVYDVNVGGAVRLVQAFAPAMVAAGRGNFALVSSINGYFGAPGLAAYASSKGGLDALTRTLALELAPQGVRVNGIAPASIDTPLLRASFARLPDPAAALAKNVLRHPLGRLGTPADVASLLLFLCSDEAAWITGATVPIDGGASIARR